MSWQEGDRDSVRLAGSGESAVSVAMCTYNGARFLPEQLESIAGQTVLPDQMVVCDDGSSDATLHILREFAAKSPFPVRIHENAETMGPAANFARCLSLCRGEILLLTDQDDVWFPYRVAETVEAFAGDAGLSFAFSDAVLIDDAGRELGRTLFSDTAIPRADRRRLGRGTSVTPVIHRWGMVYGCTLAIRASYLDSALPVPGLWGHDTWIAFVLSGLGPSRRLRRPVTRYRQHASQAMGAEDWSLGNRVKEARGRTEEAYRSELRRYELGMEALQRHPEVRDRLMPVLAGQYGFLRERLGIRAGGWRRLPGLARLVLRGEYWRRGAGLRSLVKDAATVVGALPR